MDSSNKWIIHLIIFTLQIIGGLTWCIDNCNVDLDIDLHFDESLVIGQKM